jgi:putative (di)nucleoside polyphosphate hydrolase
MLETEMKYRSNVAAILRNAAGKILICERLGVPGAWQFPQGGIDGTETPEEALIREVWEEVGVPAEQLHIVSRRGPFRYVYDNGRIKRGFHGKEQLYFLCDFTGADDDIDVNVKSPEFQAYRWIAPKDFRIEWLPEMKRDVYRTVFSEFFKVTI